MLLGEDEATTSALAADIVVRYLSLPHGEPPVLRVIVRRLSRTLKALFEPPVDQDHHQSGVI